MCSYLWPSIVAWMENLPLWCEDVNDNIWHFLLLRESPVSPALLLRVLPFLCMFC